MEHNKFVNYIIPKKKNKNKKKTCELGFLETVKLLSELFLFHKRWNCLNLTKRDSDDYLGFASVVNKNCDDFKLGELSYKKNIKTAINSDIKAHRKIIKNRVRHTKSEDELDKVIRKYITVKVLNKSVRFQLDSGSDLSIINLQTWRRRGEIK